MVSGYVLSLTHESADALRDFADGMKKATADMAADTQALISVYNAVAESVGTHRDDFHSLIQSVQKSQDDAAQAIDALAPMLAYTADKIDNYVERKV